MHTSNELQRPMRRVSLARPVMIGAGIALVLITIFLLGVRYPDPSWPRLWFLRPLVIVPLAGACGGALFSIIARLGSNHGWQRALSILAGLLVYLVGLWLGTVLGLAGTLWH